MSHWPSGAPSQAHTGGPPAGAAGGVDHVGRYELIRRLGSGGMAEVHLARASAFEGFEKLVVLKRILPHLSADPHFINMFLAEARLAAILDHPNIVQVFDLGVDDDQYFFTMELVYGENLQTVLRTAQRRGIELPYPLAIAIGVGAAAGLHYAHERVGWDGKPLGIVHRDVSPTNVMITYDGCVKVADFGIAKVTSRTDITRAGMRKGKVPYMSPEQCRAEKIDRRSDIFALGIVLYECSTGTRLFDGDNEFGVMNRIVTGDIPPPSSRRSGYPKDLERIVMRALQVDPNERYGSARELQTDLERLARERKLDAGPSAMAGFMHRLYQPEPFPWGALQGTSGPGGAELVTAAGMAGISSHSGIGTPAGPPDVTPTDASSWARSRTNAGSVGSVASVKEIQRAGQLRGLALGLSLAAGFAVLVVGGLWIAKRSGTSDPTSAAPPAGAAAGAGAIEARGDDAEHAAPDELPGLPPADALDEVGNDPGGDEAAPADEPVLVIEEDPPTSDDGEGVADEPVRETTKHRSSRGAKKSDKPRRSKTKSRTKGSKKPDPDAFFPQ